MKKYKLILFILILSIGYINGQDILKTANVIINPESPTSTQFLRYDQMPVSEYTGIPNISIPLYTVQVDEVTIPLILRYHAGGIKVTDIASWVGLGWDLSLPNIIQSINGEDDFIKEVDGVYRILPDYQSSNNNYFYKPYPWNTNVIDNGYDCSLPCNIKELPIYQPQLAYGYRTAFYSYFPVKGEYKQNFALYQGRRLDTEPDVFIANIFGERIHFILEFKDSLWGIGKVLALNKKGYSIDFYSHDYCVIENPQGTTFEFSTRIETNSFSNSVISGGTATTRSKSVWLLTKVTTKNKKTIEFKYGANSVFKQNYVSQYAVERTSPETSSRLPLHYNFPQTNVLMNYKPDKINTITTTTTERQYYIESIKFPAGIINFYTSEGRQDISLRKLDSLTVSPRYGANVEQRVNLNYDYFQDRGASSKRLRLSSITINSTQSYQFRYNKEQLPPVNSYAVDFWGYYNGHHANISYIANPSRFRYKESEHINNGNNHSANLPYTKACILEEIIYPTGGKVEFDYELNEFKNIWVPDYNSKDNKQSKGYGLRVKNITHRDKDEIQKLTSYEYKSGQSVIDMEIIRFFQLESAIVPFIYPGTGEYVTTRESLARISTDGLSCVTPFSSHSTVGYDTVIVVNKGRGGMNVGKTISVFHNNKHITNLSVVPARNHIMINLPSIKKSNKPENGSLKTSLHYNDKGVLVQEKKCEYKNILSDIYYGVKITRTNNPFNTMLNVHVQNPIPCRTQHLMAFYPIYDFETLLTKESIVDYYGKDSLKIDKEYTHNNYHQVNSILTSTSDAQKKIRQDFTYLDANNRHADLTTINKYLITNDSPLLVSTKDMEYSPRLVRANGSNVYVYFPCRYREKKGSFNSSNELRETSYERYETYFGNLIQKKGSDNKYTSYIWSYSGQYPIAIVENATYEEI